jgi:hypothetical protein
MSGDERGYIVVETVGAFVPFLLLVISILSLVNIIAVQARVHYALTQAAGTLSVYSYTLEVMGIANDLTALDAKADRVKKEADAFWGDINAALTGIDSLSGVSDAAGHGKDAIERVFGWGEEIAGDPKAALQLLMNYCINDLRNKVFDEMARPLVGRFLSSEGMSGNEYLLRARVVNSNTGKRGLDALEFYRHKNKELGSSVLLDKDGNIKLVVEYEIEYTFGGLKLPFSPTLQITQTAITKASLNGSGEGYR